MCDLIKYYGLPLNYLDCIVPVPLDARKLREREFNQAQVLSKHIGEVFNMKVIPDALRRTRPTKSQAELDINSRLKNVEGCFALNARHSLRGKNVLLVDDVFTTGSTASEAAQAIKESGSGFVFVLTLAN
jgi:ComF family protein